MDLTNRRFKLMENTSGHASAATIIQFGPESHPMRATYFGPNVLFGHAIVFEHPDQSTEMLYHALTSKHELVAGQATVSLIEREGDCAVMELEWRWLTEAESSGVSIWHEIAGPGTVRIDG